MWPCEIELRDLLTWFADPGVSPACLPPVDLATAELEVSLQQKTFTHRCAGIVSLECRYQLGQ